MTTNARTIFVVIVPWDYASADIAIFDTREEAQQYIDHEVEGKARDYARIQEATI